MLKKNTQYSKLTTTPSACGSKEKASEKKQRNPKLFTQNT